MTREEFTKGWTLLIIQPWGKRYSAQDTPAKLQFEFYWDRLHRYTGEVWGVACQLFAGSDHWPSVDEIRTTINHSLPSRHQLTHHAKGEEKPEFLVKVEAYRRLDLREPAKARGHITILEAAEAVLPEFMAQHPGHEDIEPAKQLIANLKAYRAEREVMQQEREANRAP